MDTADIVSTLLTFVIFVLGTIVTILAPTTRKGKARWLVALLPLGMAALALQIRKVQDDAAVNITRKQREDSLLEDAKAARKQAEEMRVDFKIESARRFQAEHDLTLKVQSVGEQTQRGVTDDLRKNPIPSGQAVISARLWSFDHKPPKTVFDVMVENNGNLRTNVTVVPSVFIDGKPYPLRNAIDPELELVPLSYKDFDIPVVLNAEEDMAVWAGKSELSLHLVIDYSEQPGGKRMRFTYRGKFDVAQRRMVSTSERTPL